MNRIGIHAFVWTGGSGPEDLEAAMEKSHRLGYQLIEFPRLDPQKFDIGWLARRLRDFELEIAVTMGLPAAGDITSEDPAIVAQGERILDTAVAVTRDLGGRKLGGIIFSAHGKYQSMPTRKGWDHSVGVIRRVAERAQQAGVTLNLEVVNRFESNLLNTTAQGMAFLADVGAPNVYLHLDTFHMNIEEADPAQAIRLAGDRLGYFHIGESHRGYLGTGTVNFDRIFDALVEQGYADVITFESFSSEVVDKDLSIIAGIWRNTWSDNVPLAAHAKAFIEARLADARRRAAQNRTP